VVVVQVADGDAATVAVAAVAGRVSLVRRAAGDSGVVVVVQVADGDAATVAVAAVAGRVSLVRRAAGG
jgi:hypothetical protein